MGKTIRSRKFEAPLKAKDRKKNAAVKNSAHVKHDAAASVKAPKPRQDLTVLKLDWTYADICLFSDHKAKKLSQTFEVVPKPNEKLLCWQCGSVLQNCSTASSSSGSSAVDCKECPLCRTASRHKLQLTHCSLAYTPWWQGAWFQNLCIGQPPKKLGPGRLYKFEIMHLRYISDVFCFLETLKSIVCLV